MPVSFVDRRIRRAFSNAAGQYDILTTVHREIARALTDKAMAASRGGYILDVGMGTGWMTERLSVSLPRTKVVGLDFADGMVKEAKEKYNHLAVIQADACRMPFKPRAFDMIVSNFAYQWMGELDRAFRQCRHILKEEGKILMTVFGYETFSELFDTLNRVSDGQVDGLNRLAGKEDITKALLDARFHDVRLETEMVSVRFQDMFGLLKWVKRIGANGLGHSLYLGNDLLKKANQYYVNHYQDRIGVYATLEVIWIEAHV